MKWLNFLSLGFWLSMFDVKLGLGGGGGGGGGGTKFEWNDDIKPYWESTLAQGSNIAGQPYTPYPNPRIADLNSTETGALDAITNFAKSSGSPVTQAANGQLQQTLGGDYLTGPGANPYGNAENGWRDMSAPVDRNAYEGENPYFLDKLNQGMDEIGAKYRDFTAPDTQSQFVLNGTFGGGDYQRAVANNEGALAKNLSQYATGMFSDQYDKSAGLEENYLNRNLQNAQFDKSTGTAIDEAALNRGNSDYEAERARQLAAVNPGQNEQALALQRYQAAMGAGDAYRTVDQQKLDQGYQDYLTSQNYDKNQAAWFASMLSGAQGGLGPTQTTTSSVNPWSTALGATLLGTGMFKL